MRRLLSVFCLGWAFAAWSAGAIAQSYPTRPIRLIVPFPPGGTSDVLGRMVALRLGPLYGQTIIVDNRPGASGHLGAEQAAKAPPDGYTLVAGTIGIHAAYAIYRKLNYNPSTDLQPVMVLAELPNVLTVHPSVPAKTVKEFVALAKKHPGELNYGSAGAGSSIHMVTELFMLATGTKLTHVPYKGSGPALTDLMGGQIQVIFENLPTALPLIESGKLRAIAVTSEKRAPSLPALPTVAESGVPGYAATSWFTIAAPKGVPQPLIEKLNADMRRVLTTPEAIDEFRKFGISLVANTPAEANKFFALETKKWSKVIEAANIRLD
jgi:tripartite-type tricarboxylate transporter receptor subunit TctC